MYFKFADFFCSYSFGIETMTTFILSRNSQENHTQFQIKIGKVYARFQTKTTQRKTDGWGELADV